MNAYPSHTSKMLLTKTSNDSTVELAKARYSVDQDGPETGKAGPHMLYVGKYICTV